MHWLLIIENSSNFTWSFFLKEKSNLADVIIGLIKNLNNKYNLQDNKEESVAFDKACKQEGLGVVFEQTAPGTSQQNGHIERKFTTIFNWVCAMLNNGKYNKKPVKWPMGQSCEHHHTSQEQPVNSK